jgi:hypothetical protein
MNPYTVINVVTNVMTAISSGALLIHVFGDPDNAIWNDTVKAWLAKTGLAITTCGAVANALTLSNPGPTEVLLNLGISLTFCWLSWWQWDQFQAMKQAAQKKRRRKKIEVKDN